jgi:hypothetical protein
MTSGFVQEDVLRLAEISASDCKRLCASKELALCLDLVLGKVDLVHAVHKSPVQCEAWLCGFVHRSRRM